MWGSIIGVSKEDARSLDHSSFGVRRFLPRILVLYKVYIMVVRALY